MENWWRYGGAIAVYVPLIVIFVVGRSEGKELRPSEHGLAYQSNATAVRQKSPEMLSFFGPSTASPKTPAAIVPMPEAKNMSDASWWREVSGGGGRRDHVRDALVVATVVCGGTGVVLLVVAAVLFLFRYQRRRSNGRPK